MRASQTVTPVPANAEEDDGAVAARCFHLAAGMAPGPIRDALLAMGREYSTRARARVRTMPSRPARGETARAARVSLLTRMVDQLTTWLEPVPARAPRRAPAPQPGAAMPRIAAADRRPTAVAPSAQPARATPTPQRARVNRGARLFRINALKMPGA